MKLLEVIMTLFAIGYVYRGMFYLRHLNIFFCTQGLFSVLYECLCSEGEKCHAALRRFFLLSFLFFKDLPFWNMYILYCVEINMQWQHRIPYLSVIDHSVLSSSFWEPTIKNKIYIQYMYILYIYIYIILWGLQWVNLTTVGQTYQYIYIYIYIYIYTYTHIVCEAKRYIL